MKRSLIIFLALSFHQSITWAAYSSRQTPPSNRVGESNRQGEIQEANSWQICVNHRVSSKGESFSTAGAWCSQYFQVEHQVPPADEPQGSSSDVSI